jgi:hypothetical protein
VRQGKWEEGSGVEGEEKREKGEERWGMRDEVERSES